MSKFIQSLLVPTLALVAIFTACESVQAQNRIEGTATAPSVRNLPPLLQPRLLSGFDVSYRNSDGDGTPDRHFKVISVLPDRDNESKYTIDFRDKTDEGDSYSYLANYALAPSRTRVTLGGFGERDSVTTTQAVVGLERPSADHVFVLRGFHIAKFHGDYHVERIAVFEDDGLLVAAYEHSNGGFGHLASSGAFEFIVEYAYLPSEQIAAKGQVNGLGRGGTSFELPDGDRVLRGFDLRFVQGDKHISNIAVDLQREGTGDAYVSFSDKGFDNNYTYSIRWATLGNAPQQDPVPGPE